jgi:FlaA1/EpsC-like NDP-sugar epimerase
LFILDRDESALLEVSLTLQKSSNDSNVEILLADIRDEKRISDLLLSTKPEIVFHAAALKHLNILESHPEEAYKTNVLGTNILLRASVNSNVKTFVNISTDKAVDPSSVLGKTKLIAEMLTAGFANKFSGKDTKFLSVRFGNVFGSRGSVLHTFLKQIEQGGPITVTDPLVKRYFMTIEDAIHLLLKAATQGKTGETLILKMGEPISILDIAKKLVKSSGKTIDIKFTSLRPGEKLNESLVGINENLINSDLEGIFITKVKPLEWNDAPNNWKQLNERF